ncbi:hypothetical protein [uncultured Psychroserpens sp.]|uniref:transglutaminase domain-containing protein n=1 Tax=uncultured Psychroserpens sp. TaxID=255436 RepID=UPI0026086589|nr:hypothetical protein [uncultured Psychroserpens sp.]
MKRLISTLIFICHISYAQVSDFKNIDFTRADNIAKLNEGANLDNLAILAHNLTSTLPTQVEKFRAIHTWVCHNIKADSNQHDIVARKRRTLENDSIAFMKWNNSYKKIAFQKLLKRKETMCTGYAYLIKELCFLANLDCVIVDGYARTIDSNIKKLESPNHSWNAVNLGGKWYLSDATWSSGYIKSGNVFVRDYNEGYFLADPILYAKSHYPLNKKWLLDDSLINSKFVAGPLVYAETFKQHITPLYPKKMNVDINKNTEISFSFKSENPISNKKIALVKINRTHETSLTISDLKNENGLISFKHLFKHRGTHDVHLKINNDIVATYTIHVNKMK